MPAATLSKTDVMMSPSILSADFMALRESVSQVSNGADFIHVDVMDGHFVPNLTIGPMFVKGLAGCFSNPLDVHLMVDNPESTSDWYIDAGASLAMSVSAVPLPASPSTLPLPCACCAMSSRSSMSCSS